MVRLIRRRVLLAYYAIPFLPLMAFLAFSLFLTIPACAGERTIVVDEDNPPRTRSIKPSRNTKVISIRNTAASGEKGPVSDGDICRSLGGYYCRSVGKRAYLRVDQDLVAEGGPVLTVSSISLGLITGVAWRNKGQSMGLYLGELKRGMPLEEALSKNTLSMSDTFYFIILVEGLEGPVLVEPHRIDTGE